MRVGVLLSEAVGLLHAFGGLLVAQFRAMQEPSGPARWDGHRVPLRRAIRAPRRGP